MARELTFRTASPDDAQTASTILTTALQDLARRQGRPAPGMVEDAATPVMSHLIDTDAGRFWLAAEGRRVVGFGAGWVRGELGYCGGLFVLPAWQGQGVGSRLFELAVAGMPANGAVALTSSAANPVSNRLYGRHGVYPFFALLTMAGPATAPADAAHEGDDDGLAAEPLTPDSLGDLRRIDEAVLGVDRTPDHRWFLGGAGDEGWLFRRDGVVAGYAYLGGDRIEGAGQVGPLSALRAEDQPGMLRFALARLAARGVPEARVLVPGPAVAAQRVLWEAGFSFTDVAGLLCASRPFGHFDRYLLAGDALL